MELRSVRYCQFWLLLVLLFGFLSGCETAITTLYLRTHRDLLDLHYINAPLAGVAMLVWAGVSGLRLTKCYRDLLSEYNKKFRSEQETSLTG